jgi:hypothetical protein
METVSFSLIFCLPKQTSLKRAMGQNARHRPAIFFAAQEIPLGSDLVFHSLCHGLNGLLI